jgi:hypothetical protein
MAMTTPLNPWGDKWVNMPHRMAGREHVLNRRRARRISRHFAEVGVEIPAARLQQIAAGVPAAEDELSDVRFAFIATEIQRSDRRAKLRHAKRHAMHWLIVAGMVLAALNVLACMAYLFFSFAQHTSPF